MAFLGAMLEAHLLTCLAVEKTNTLNDLFYIFDGPSLCAFPEPNDPCKLNKANLVYCGHPGLIVNATLNLWHHLQLEGFQGSSSI